MFLGTIINKIYELYKGYLKAFFVWLSVCGNYCPSIYPLSIYPSIFNQFIQCQSYLSIVNLIYSMSIFLSIVYLSIHCPSIHPLSINLFIDYLSIVNLSIHCQSIYLFIVHLSIHCPSIYPLSIYLSTDHLYINCHLLIYLICI